jgi:D-sedoheptulose 7-phosphate isomerase
MTRPAAAGDWSSAMTSSSPPRHETSAAGLASGGEATALIEQRIHEAARLKLELLEGPLTSTIAEIAGVVASAYRSGGKVLLFGNGGSAADAQHICGELLGRYQRDRPPLPAHSLAESSSSLTAIANDYAFEEVFARQITGLGSPGDVAIGLSTSGESENVIRGLRTAREQGLVGVAFTGGRGGGLSQVADYCVSVPATETPRIQEAHMLIGHLVCELVEGWLFPTAE